MSSGSLARRYAKALMEIGSEDGSYKRIGQDVAGLASAIKTSSELASIMSNPVFPRADREKIILAILQRLGASVTVVNFAKLLLDRERISAIPDISRALNAMIDELAGQITAEVLTAAPLTASQQAELKSTLETLSGKTVQIDIKEDKSLLGGVVAKVGDLVYDGSLRSQLQEIQRSLAQ